MSAAIEELAAEDERAIAWMVRKLLEEALLAKGKLKPKKSPKR